MPKNPNRQTKSPAGGRTGVWAAIAIVFAPVIWLVGSPTESGSLDWLRSLIIAVGLALVIRWTFAEPFRIPSGSMEPTLHGDPGFGKGDRVFVNKWIYGLRWPLNHCRVVFTDIKLDYAKSRIWTGQKPKRWDIVVFKTNEPDAIHTTLVKRVVGLPGERIHIADGKVFVNGEALEMPPELSFIRYTSPTFYDSEMKYGILPDGEYSVVPPDSYLVLGDNSAHSRDGRYFGWLPEEHIMGRVACIWFPPSRWRDFTGFSGTWWWRALLGLLAAATIWRFFLGRFWRTHFLGSDGEPRAAHVVINRVAFGLPLPFTNTMLARWGAPKRGDLVFYHHKGKADEPKLLVGRIAGLPGERVFLEEGRLLVDDAPAFEGRTFAATEGVGRYAKSKGKEFSLVPEGHYFILTESDVPEEHWDGRTLGWTPRASLLGRASFVWWPPKQWRRV